MKLSEMGEFRFLKKIMRILDENELGKFDDAIAIKVNENYLVLNIDTLVRRTDIPPGMTPHQIGNKVVVMATSDIIVKGATPNFFVASITIPKEEDVEYLEEIEYGIKYSCSKYGIKFFGGDLNDGLDLMISGVSVGFTKKIIPRKGAKIGDSVWTTGYFGETGAGLHYLLKGGIKTRNIDGILKKVFEPSLPFTDGKILLEIANSSIDSSDGLSISLHQLSSINNVKIVLEEIPIAENVINYASVNEIDPIIFALYGGEEFEIIFTTSHKDEDVIETFKSYGYKPPHKIGKVSEGRGVEYRGERVEESGWEHFSEQKNTV